MEYVRFTSGRKIQLFVLSGDVSLTIPTTYKPTNGLVVRLLSDILKRLQLLRTSCYDPGTGRGEGCTELLLQSIS